MAYSLCGWAQIPLTIAYQARLTNSVGAPVSGTQSIQFSLYDVATGGTALWTETQSVTLVNGELSLSLGETTSLPEAVFAKRLFLGIKVGSDAEMTPRPKLNSAPYSIKARSPLVRTVFVPHGGNNSAAGTALVTAMTGLTAVSAIQLDPGNYDLGSAGLTLPANVTLSGAGRRQTALFSADPLATINLSSGSIVQDLTAINTGPGAGGSNDGAAAIRILDGANEARVLNAEMRSTSAGSVGIRNSLWVGAANSVLIEDSTIVASGGGSLRGILANTGSASARLRIVDCDVDVFAGNVSTQAIGAYLLGHQDIQIIDTRLVGRGIGSSLIGLLAQGANVEVTGGSSSAAGEAGSVGSRIGLQLVSPLFTVLRGTRVEGRGAGSLLIGIDASGNNTHQPVQLRDTVVAANGNAPETIGIRAEGIGPQLDNSYVFVTPGGNVAPTKVIGVELLPAIVGVGQSLFFGGYNRIQVQHAIGTDLGGGIVSTGASISQRYTEVNATDDGIEVGVSASAANPNNQLSLRHTYIQSGRTSIRKNQNWSLTTRHLDVIQPVILESGGTVSCLASTTSGGGGIFLATGCPTP